MGFARWVDGRVGVIVVAVALPASVVAGCGGSSGPGAGGGKLQRASPSTSPAGVSAPPVRTSTASKSLPVSIDVTIPVLLKSPLLGIPERYTCYGADVSLPVRWSSIPRGATELALFVIGLRPVHGEFHFSWAVTGLRPSHHGISSGRLPQGTVVGRNSFGGVGYSLCPPKGRRETYLVKILALPRSLDAAPGFNANTLYHRAEAMASAVGFAAVAFTGR